MWGGGMCVCVCWWVGVCVLTLYTCTANHYLKILNSYAAALMLRNTRKKLSKKPVVREMIKTVSKYDLQRARRKREMVEGSKRRKGGRTGGH